MSKVKAKTKAWGRCWAWHAIDLKGTKPALDWIWGSMGNFTKAVVP
jgi:hypothetical protein